MEVEISARTESRTLSSTPRLVVTRITPFAPRAPYRAAALASFITEKLPMSSTLRRARSEELISIPSIRINGSFLPAPNEVTPRMKNSASSSPGSPERWYAITPAS